MGQKRMYSDGTRMRLEEAIKDLVMDVLRQEPDALAIRVEIDSTYLPALGVAQVKLNVGVAPGMSIQDPKEVAESSLDDILKKRKEG